MFTRKTERLAVVQYSRAMLPIIRDLLSEVRAWKQAILQAMKEEAESENPTAAPGSAQQPICTLSPHNQAIRDKEKEQKKQYRTQQGLRRAAWCGVIAAVGYATIAAFQWCEMQKAVESAEGANRIASHAIEAQNRPWIGIEGDLGNPSVEIVLSNPAVEVVNFTFSLRNYGQSPATQVDAAFFLSKEPLKEAQFKESGVCSRTDSVSNQKVFKFLISVFPHDSSTLQSGTAQSQSWSFPARNINPIEVTRLAGCITYQGQEGHLYHTRVVYKIVPKDKPTTKNGIQYMPIERLELRYTETD